MVHPQHDGCVPESADVPELQTTTFVAPRNTIEGELRGTELRGIEENNDPGGEP